MISLWVLLFMALFTVALAHRSEWFHTSVSNTLGTTMIRIVKKFHIVASNDLDILCLTETHVGPFDSDSFLRSITPVDYIFPQRSRPSGIGGGVVFFH